MYEDLGGKERSRQVPSNAEEAKKFWSKLWDNPVPYKEDAEWLKKVELKFENVNIQENVEITKEDVAKQLRKIPNCKAPGLDGIQGFTNQHQMLTEEFNENLNSMQSLSISSWLVKKRTVLIQKDP